jgi:DUF1680 family protein
MSEQWGRPVAPKTGALHPLGMAEVQLEGGFWGERQQLNGDVILRHAHGWVERMGWIENFRAAAEGRVPADFRGPLFADSDVYKLAEGLAWEVGRSGDAELDAVIGEIATAAAGAQEADGYLNTRYGHQAPDVRYSDLEWGHELYSYGHLIQAAVARARTHGEDELVAVARRVADHVCETFGSEGVCGHPEIEPALVELFRATGEERYLEQARLFVNRRGGPALKDIARGREYFQDEQPLREARAFRGHAVRAVYLACGAVDVAVETGDRELLDVIVAQWERTIAARTYITGGMGSRHSAEDFGEDFELPPDRAYSETCAGIASVMLCWRLLLATGEARYADLAERTLYNVVATSPALDGRGFFYANPLHQRVPGAAPDPDAVSPRASSSMRAPWFNVACCPTNIGRTLASLGGYVATGDARGVQIHQFAPATITVGTFAVRVETGYPWTGEVVVRVHASDDRPRTLALRVPAWATGATLDGRPVAPGYATVERVWQAGDELRLALPLAPRWTFPDPRVDAVRGCVAAERGPIVYCLESTDQEHDTLDGVAVDTSAPPAERPLGEEAGGGVGLTAVGVELDVQHADAWPYDGGGRAERTTTRLAFVPYHAWGNRGPSTMRVWTPVA